MNSSGQPRARSRILLIEDDPDAALFAVHVLATRGQFEVVHAADPVTALRLAADEPWDLILTDAELPGMSGIDLVSALRQLAPGVPVVMLTAHALSAADLRPYVDEFLAKPIRSDVLVAIITSLVRREAC